MHRRTSERGASRCTCATQWLTAFDAAASRTWHLSASTCTGFRSDTWLRDTAASVALAATGRASGEPAPHQRIVSVGECGQKHAAWTQPRCLLAASAWPLFPPPSAERLASGQKRIWRRHRSLRITAT